MEVLYKALTIKQIKKRMDEDNYIEGIVAVDLSEIIDNDYDGFIDLISEKLVGDVFLMDVEYSAVGCDGNDTIFIKVSGDASNIL